MVKKKKTEEQKRIKGLDLKTGRHSKYLDEFKKRTGLVTMDEIRDLPIDQYEQLQKKIKLMDEYTVANQKLVDLFGSVGGRAVNALNQVVDLQARLLEFEDNYAIRQEEAKKRLEQVEKEIEEFDSDNKYGLNSLKKEQYELRQLILSSVMDSPTWQNLRKQISLETQFIHKHGLDIAEVQSRIRSRATKKDDDVLFDIENVKEGEIDDSSDNNS